MKVIANSGPIIALAKLGLLGLLNEIDARGDIWIARPLVDKIRNEF